MAFQRSNVQTPTTITPSIVEDGQRGGGLEWVVQRQGENKSGAQREPRGHPRRAAGEEVRRDGSGGGKI